METAKLTKVIRCDSMPLNGAEFTEEGYFIDRPILTTTGIFEYTNSDGSVRRELRLPEDVFDEESLKSYKGKPIIITHDAGLITKENVADEQIGTILSEGYRDGRDVRAEICIHDTNEMKRSGLKELSLGYNLELEETPGIWKGERYDAIQRKIQINHLALVREARAGETARLNLDGKTNNILTGGKKMTKKSRKSRLDSILSEKELEEAIKQYKERMAKSTEADEDDVEEEIPEKKVTKKPGFERIKSKKPAKKVCRPKVEEDEDEEDEKKFVPEDEDSKKVIARQDEDIRTLFDIIDTLLAERDFKDAQPKIDSADEEDEDADYVDEFDKDEDELEEDDEFEEDEDDEIEDEYEEFEEDEDDEFEDEEEFEEDEDDDFEDEDDEFVEDEDDDEDDEFEEDITMIGKKPMNADSVDAIVKTRIKLGLLGQQLHMDGLEDMTIKKAKCAIIKKVRPGMRLDGKSSAYINAAFDCVESLIDTKTKKTTANRKKQMFNKKTSRNDGNTYGVSGAEAARRRMIKKSRKED